MNPRDLLALWVVIGALGIAVMSRVAAGPIGHAWGDSVISTKVRTMEEQLMAALSGREHSSMIGVRVGFAQSTWNDLKVYEPTVISQHLRMFDSPEMVEQALASAWAKVT